MKTISFINGSPRGKESASQYFIDEVGKLLGNGSYKISKIILNNSIDYEEIISSDILILVFPLYVDCLPSEVIQFLCDFEQWTKKSSKPITVYAVVNCGFYEGIQSKHAIQIIKNFCDKVGYKWRFGIGIGAGEFLRETKDNIPLESKVKVKIYEALHEVKKDIEINEDRVKQSIFTSPNFPRFLYMLAGNMSWIKSAKIKGVNKKQVYAKPFSEKV